MIRAASCENRLFAYAKTKTQISFAVTAKLISDFVFAIRIVQSFYFLNPKFQVSSDLLWLHSPVCVGNPEDRFSHNEAHKSQSSILRINVKMLTIVGITFMSRFNFILS